MKEQSQIATERKIVSRVKMEMEKPRLTEPVRSGVGTHVTQTVAMPAAGSARA
jgi:hypothetical protein